MDLLLLIIIGSAPFLLASLVKKAAKDIFPTLECCIFMVEALAIYFFFMVHDCLARRRKRQ